jgi:3'(2'), 5'-bisphosphate nucleotidase
VTLSHLYERELRVAAELAREAGKVAMKYRDGDIEVEMKPGDEPVTAADHAASDLIVAGLREAFPEDVIISEESEDDLRRLEDDRVWYIDPIDGTKDFIRKRDGFCVMIGLCLRHEPVAGVLYQPVGDNLFSAAKGFGSWFEPPEGPPRRLQVSDIDDPAAIRLVASRSHRTPKMDEVKSALGINTEFNIGSVGLKLGLIALGERDLYVNPSSKCKAWDTCAPEIVLTEAGGKITDLFGDPLHYDEEDTVRRKGMLATNGHVHEACLERVSPLFRDGLDD